MSGRKVLLVDDDVDLRESLAEQLELVEDFETFEAGCACDGLKFLEDNEVDLLIFDVGLPDMDGRELCKRVRKNGITVPIIMLTGMDTEADTVLGLESGANDYVTKPFSFNILLARIRAHFRQFAQSEDATFDIGPYIFKPTDKTLDPRDGTRPIKLTEKETNILRYLYKAAGKAVGRDELLEKVWGYNSGVTTHTLETHIYRLRQKVEPPKDELTNHTRIILTEPGGYALGATRF